MKKKFLFLILSLFMFLGAFLTTKPVETELMRAFLNPTSPLIKLSGVSSNYLNVILESDSENGIEDLKSFLPQNKIESASIFEVYKNYPENFLSAKTKKLIQTKQYKTLDEEALARVYNPLGFYIAPPDKDPYLLATDFVSSLINQEQEIKQGGKFYLALHYKIKDASEVQEFINAQKMAQEEFENSNIYFTGAPIHSFVTSQKSALEINLICLISTLMLAILCKFYFKSFKILIPIVGSILFGFLFGFSISTFVFKKLHVLTFVFSTSLIGISLDYSLHKFLTGKEKWFKKDLTASMLTTVIAFFVLLLSDMQVLKQIAVFTAFGLIGVYLFVLIVLDNKFKFQTTNFPKISLDKFKPYILIAMLGVIVLGFSRLKFDDNIKNLYIPPKNLLNAEMLYQKVFAPKAPEFILVEGKNIDEILQKEEELGINDSVSLSKFISSTKLQKENQELVKGLYDENLTNYGAFLAQDNIQKIKNKKMQIYNVENFALNQEFMLDKNTSYVMISEHRAGAISPVVEITKQLKAQRKNCMLLFPLMFGALFVFLSFLFGFKNAILITLSPLGGILFALGLISLLGHEINLFNIIALFLVTGFSLDYSIFRLNGQEKSKDAVFMSALSTMFSFLLLSLTSFKVVSSLGLTLFVGILGAYLLSLILIKK